MGGRAAAASPLNAELRWRRDFNPLNAELRGPPLANHANTQIRKDTKTQRSKGAMTQSLVPI